MLYEMCIEKSVTRDHCSATSGKLRDVSPSEEIFYHTSYPYKTNRIYQRSLMQTEKSQPEGKRIMPERRFTEFPALSVDLRVGISRSASETDD